jgi:hypothetical protein
MRTISMALLAGLLGSAAVAAAAVPPTAVPQSTVSQVAQAPADLPWLPAAASTAAVDPLGSLLPSEPGQQVCLCVLGDHCCVVHGKQTCVPNSQPCP